jgi:enamine deaminase RidA (YjgF/YER057c/UK114 family)
MIKRSNISSGTLWEDLVGYSRAVKVGNMVEVAGTTAVDKNGEIVGIADAYAQTNFIFQKIEAVLEKAGASMEHVVRTRIFVTDISLWEEVGKAHGEWFKLIKPAATMVEVSALIQSELLVEIEVSAILNE